MGLKESIQAASRNIDRGRFGKPPEYLRMSATTILSRSNCETNRCHPIRRAFNCPRRISSYNQRFETPPK